LAKETNNQIVYLKLYKKNKKKQEEN